MSNALSLSIPTKEVSAWVVETSPKETRAWLASLPMADSATSAREIYQFIYTLNRLDLGPQDRLKLMELYREPLATVSSALQTHLARAILPLTPKKRQLAEFLRQLHMEMATAYKCVIHDSQHLRMLWGKKKLQAEACYYALRYLGEVLQLSYQVYIPCPAGSWQEIHELYHFAELNNWFAEHLEGQGAKGKTVPAIYQLYLQIVLLGLCHPYQLPQGEWRHINGFLQRWASTASIRRELNIANTAGHFLIDLSKDSPPAPYPKDVELQSETHLRALNTLGLASKVQTFINDIKKGVPRGKLELGMECLDSACLDMLRRMMRFWGLVMRRQQTRTKRRGYSFLATGINAVHFFSAGQKPFSPPGQASPPAQQAKAKLPEKLELETQQSPAAGEDFVDLDAVTGKPGGRTENQPGLADALLNAREVYRVDRWQVVDESVGGLQFANSGNQASHVRVGDLVGIQDASNPDSWRASVVRWMKSPDVAHIEIGVAMLGSAVKPVAVKALQGNAYGGEYVQALWLPPIEALRRPATLVVPRGLYQADGKLLLAESTAAPRQVKIMKLIEHTGSFEHLVFATISQS